MQEHYNQSVIKGDIIGLCYMMMNCFGRRKKNSYDVTEVGDEDLNKNRRSKVKTESQQVGVIRTSALPDQQVGVIRTSALPDQQVGVIRTSALPDQQVGVIRTSALPDQQVRISTNEPEVATLPIRRSDELVEESEQPVEVLESRGRSEYRVTTQLDSLDIRYQSEDARYPLEERRYQTQENDDDEVERVSQVSANEDLEGQQVNSWNATDDQDMQNRRMEMDDREIPDREIDDREMYEEHGMERREMDDPDMADREVRGRDDPDMEDRETSLEDREVDDEFEETRAASGGTRYVEAAGDDEAASDSETGTWNARLNQDIIHTHLQTHDS